MKYRQAILTALLLCVLLPAWAGIPGGDFLLHTPDGRPVSLTSLRGRVVLLYFGFTACPVMCPTELLTFQRLLASMPADKRHRVQPVFVSVDPRRDTPEALESYVANFGNGILALTGNEDELRRIAQRYGAYFRYVDTGSDYTVDHTVNTYVIDPNGRLVRILPYGTPLHELQDTVLRLLP
ncbi:SCO family protein [Sulfuricystis thermophila]|uniref:SCO family protein n=1 Tax=Sulfuricystis thermophila TaxID=2496847 RepID=UPI0010358532|nr:SCO family protein [Sulfuricystis thermophila]